MLQKKRLYMCLDTTNICSKGYTKMMKKAANIQCYVMEEFSPQRVLKGDTTDVLLHFHQVGGFVKKNEWSLR